MYKMVALDLDDTLLNDKGQITDENRNAIKKATQLGVKIIIVSGRSYSSTKQYINDLGLEHLTVSLNGAYVMEPCGDKIFFSCPIDSNIGYEILKLLEKQDIHVNFYEGEKVLCAKETDHAKYYMSLNNIKIEFVDSLSEYSKNSQIGKLLLIDERDKLDKIKASLADKFDVSVNITFSKPNFLEIYDKHASKGKAVLKVAQEYGIKPEEIIAMGDGENDISMIRAVGMGIAMGNARESVKNEAKFVTLTNNENGVAYAINKFIFGKD